MDYGLKSYFGKKFAAHIHSFSREYQLFHSSDKAIALVSGGVDSMSLLHLLNHFKQSGFLAELKVVFFDHGTRPDEIDLEKKIVESYCSQHHIAFHSIKLNLNLDLKNFEQMARNERRLALKQFIQSNHLENFLIFSGHHLDDAFEWSLRQRMRQSSIEKTLGMAVLDQQFRRPLLCVSKKQLIHFALFEDLDFAEDSSNANLRFERNKLRSNFINELKKQYPQLLKHFVSQQFELLHLLKLIQNSESVQIEKNQFGIMLYLESFLPFQDQHLPFVRSQIESLSTHKRGKLTFEIQKMLKALAQKNAYGPFKFSGGVWAYWFDGVLLLTDQRARERWREYDLNSDTTQITELCSKFACEFIVPLASKKLGQKRIHPLVPTRIDAILSSGGSYLFLPRFIRERKSSKIK